MTRSGARKWLVTFQRATAAVDEVGCETLTWADHELEWAEVLFGTGQERREAAQEAGVQAATFIVPWSPELDAVVLKDRINFDGSLWDITSKAPIGLNKELHFTASRAQ